MNTMRQSHVVIHQIDSNLLGKDKEHRSELERIWEVDVDTTDKEKL
jgi:hypothetical protein